MAHAIEVRLPFLDHKLVEFVFSIPSEFKIKNGWTKSLIRYSFNDLLPDEITWRKNKLAFQVPEKKWESNPDWQKFIKPYINICADFNYATNNSYNWSLISLGLWLKSIS
jgi:asparagine synthase (glutamine-hydrolysing)